MGRRYRLVASLGESAEELRRLFPVARCVRGKAQADGKTHWTSVRKACLFEDILDAYASGFPGGTPYVLALQLSSHPRFGVLDIDFGSGYHNTATLIALETIASQLELQLLGFQSSASGGWHIYLVAKEALPASTLENVLRRLASSAGITDFSPGSCEVFPDGGRARQALRLPGQAGSGLLDLSTGRVQRSVDGLRPELDLPWTLELLDSAANDRDAIERALLNLGEPAVLDAVKSPRGRPPKLVPPPPVCHGLPDVADLKLQANLVWKYDRSSARTGRPRFTDPSNPFGEHQFHRGRSLYVSGLVRARSRNESLRAVSFFLFFVGYIDAQERAELLGAWLAARHNALSATWSDPLRRMEVIREVLEIAGWQSRPMPKRLGYSAHNRSNRRERAASLHKLRTAISSLLASGETITYDRLQALTGLSRRTISKVRRGLPAGDWSQMIALANPNDAQLKT